MSHVPSFNKGTESWQVFVYRHAVGGGRQLSVVAFWQNHFQISAIYPYIIVLEYLVYVNVGVLSSEHMVGF